MSLKHTDDYISIILDVDGTLYFQRKMQIRMGIKLLTSLLFNKHALLEIRTILQYRRIRDHWTGTENIDREIYQYMADKTGMSADSVKEIIEKWIYRLPLAVLPSCRDRILAERIASWLKNGKQVIYYSDYPLTQKIEALGLPQAPCYYGGEEKINALKPDPKGLNVILQEQGITDKSKVLMVGDRMEKDGKAALLAGIDFFILKKYSCCRRIQYLGFK